MLLTCLHLSAVKDWREMRLLFIKGWKILVAEQAATASTHDAGAMNQRQTCSHRVRS